MPASFFCDFCHSADFFFKVKFFKKVFRVSYRLELGQAQYFIEPDLGKNCLQLVSSDVTSRQRIKNARLYRELWFSGRVLERKT